MLGICQLLPPPFSFLDMPWMYVSVLMTVAPKTAMKNPHPTQQQRTVMRKHMFGPMSSLSIMNGLAESRMRPTGGGRYGFKFGASRPLPTVFASASSWGTI